MRKALVLVVALAALPARAADLQPHECRTKPGYLYTLTDREYDNLSRAATEMGSKGVNPFTHTKKAFFLEPDLKVWTSGSPNSRNQPSLLDHAARGRMQVKMNETPFVGGLQTALKEHYGQEMGFALLVVPFNDDPKSCNVAEYTSNLKRSDMIRLMRQIADTLEAQGTIPSTIGCA